MRKILFRKLLTAAGITLGACLLLYPLLLPTENYFKLVLQLIPVAIVTGLLLLVPLYWISEKMARGITAELKTLKIDSKQTLSDYPELRPVARQITSIRMQMESQKTELEAQQEQLRALTDNMQEGLLLVGATGRVLSYNHAALCLLDRQAVRGEFDVFSLNDSPEFLELVGKALEGIRGSAVISVGGTACQILANPVTRGSMMTGAVLVLLDVTERERRDAVRREFTSDASRELKIPLNSISSIAGSMESGKVKMKEVRESARRIREESERAVSMIDDMSRLARLDDGALTEKMQQMDLCEIAEEVRDALLPLAEQKGVELTLEGESAPLQGSPEIAAEMLRNLCINAIQYNNENGSVKMKVTCTGQSAIFTVTDDGIGIPQADCGRVFERFYCVDRERSRELGGTGLGLSIVREGAEFHRAKIELDSRLGSGTTVTLFFPRSAETAAIAERDAKQNPLDVEVPGVGQDNTLIHVHDAQDAVNAEAPEEEFDFEFDEELIDEAIRETGQEEMPDESEPLPEEESEEEPAPRAKTVLEENTEAIAEELEQELAVFLPEPEEAPPVPEEPDEIIIPEEPEPDEEIRLDEPEPRLPRASAKPAFDPDIVPIDETTMDIKI